MTPQTSISESRESSPMARAPIGDMHAPFRLPEPSPFPRPAPSPPRALRYPRVRSLCVRDGRSSLPPEREQPPACWDRSAASAVWSPRRGALLETSDGLAESGAPGVPVGFLELRNLQPTQQGVCRDAATAAGAVIMKNHERHAWFSVNGQSGIGFKGERGPLRIRCGYQTGITDALASLFRGRLGTVSHKTLTSSDGRKRGYSQP